MKISLHAVKVLIVLMLISFSMNVIAYGGGARATTKCKKPRFSEMTPPKSTVVEPGSEFSFVASRDTEPKSVKVRIKGQDVPLKTEIKKIGGIRMTGNLPDDITQGYVRVAISAKTNRSCDGKGGWLLKIEDSAAQDDQPAP